MDENHEDHTLLFTSPVARSNEIRIAMSSTEENIRKLYEASKMGSIQILKTLLQEDAYLIQKVSISTSNVESPLHMSVSHGHLEFTRLLLDHNPELAAEVNTFQQTPLHLAAANGSLGIIRALLEKNTSSCLVRDQNGLIPLHYAVTSGQTEIMQELINARPQSIWLKLDNGQTILHLCVEGNHLEAIKLLTKIVANRDKDFLNTIDDAGNTILDLALMLRQIEMVGYLLSIPRVKSGTSIANFAVSNAKKESLGSKKKKSKNSKRQRQESASSSTKKMTRHWNVWRKKLKYKGDWVQEVQGTMMLVATVIATVTFQAGINPPGGIWQQDTPYNSSNYINQHYRFNNETVFQAGTAIMSYLNETEYMVYLIANTVSFLASVSVIILIISRFPLKNRACSWLLAMAMCAAVFFLTLGYLRGVQMVNSHALLVNNTAYSIIFPIPFYLWTGIVFLIVLWHIIRFFVWVVKSLLLIFRSKLKLKSATLKKMNSTKLLVRYFSSTT